MRGPRNRSARIETGAEGAADAGHAALARVAPAAAHAVDADLAGVRVTAAVAGSVHAALARTARVGAPLRRAGLTDGVAERSAGARLAAQALAAVAGVQAGPGETCLAHGAGGRAGAVAGAGETLSAVAGA